MSAVFVSLLEHAASRLIDKPEENTIGELGLDMRAGQTLVIVDQDSLDHLGFTLAERIEYQITRSINVLERERDSIGRRFGTLQARNNKAVGTFAFVERRVIGKERAGVAVGSHAK